MLKMQKLAEAAMDTELSKLRTRREERAQSLRVSLRSLSRDAKEASDAGSAMVGKVAWLLDTVSKVNELYAQMRSISGKLHAVEDAKLNLSMIDWPDAK